MRMTVATFACLLAPTGCGSDASGEDAGPPGIVAQGTGNTRTYAATGFTAVDLAGADDVDIRVGPGFSVRADGDAKLLDRLRIRLDGGTLRIDRRQGGWSLGDGHARIAVTLPQLSAASLAGSGDMAIDRVQGAAFKASGAGSGKLTVATMQVERADLSLAGSGDMRLAGIAGRLGVRVAGSGSVDAGQLTTSTADVSVAGSGSVRAVVDGPATVAVMGSGDVDLGGKARCQTTRMGSGAVRCGN